MAALQRHAALLCLWVVIPLGGAAPAGSRAQLSSGGAPRAASARLVGQHDRTGGDWLTAGSASPVVPQQCFSFSLASSIAREDFAFPTVQEDGIVITNAKKGADSALV